MLDVGDMAQGVQQLWGCLQDRPAQGWAHRGVCRPAGKCEPAAVSFTEAGIPRRENLKGCGDRGVGDTVGLEDT